MPRGEEILCGGGPDPRGGGAGKEAADARIGKTHPEPHHHAKGEADHLRRRAEPSRRKWVAIAPPRNPVARTAPRGARRGMISRQAQVKVKAATRGPLS